jgi:hypothetical protein
MEPTFYGALSNSDEASASRTKGKQMAILYGFLQNVATALEPDGKFLDGIELFICHLKTPYSSIPCKLYRGKQRFNIFI